MVLALASIKILTFIGLGILPTRPFYQFFKKSKVGLSFNRPTRPLSPA
jgi:hypothetical protein